MPHSQAQLLFVDDDPSAIHAMRVLLSDYPNPRFATSGREALRLARERAPDLIVLDANMPGMSGLEVLAILRDSPELRNVPVIMATAQDDSVLELAALQHGAVDFVSTPLAPLQFRARVEAHLRARASAAAAAAPTAAVQTQPRLATAGSANLLVVDDEIAAVHLLRQSLADVGTVHFATTGTAALQLASRIAPDLVLLDAHMPGLDGFQVCASLQDHPTLKRVPIVFVSRYDDAVNETRALNLGAADFISKPFSPAVLRARVRNLLELKRRNDAELQSVTTRWRELADARVADIVNTASDAILTCNDDLRILLANTAATTLFGRSLDDMVGHALTELIPAPAPLMAHTGSTPLRLLVARPDGQTVPVEVSASHLNDAPAHLTTLVLRDISDRERLEAATRAQHAAEADSAAKTRMMGWIAHEMGNPLNAMLGFIQLMQQPAPNPLPAASARQLQFIETSARQLQHLLADLLTMARSSTPNLPIELQALAPWDCLKAACDAVQNDATQAQITLTLPAPAQDGKVLADAQRLHQCLVNLLSNDIKYNHPGGEVRTLLSVDAGCVVLAVQDTGQGMSEAQLKHLFEPFNRLGRQHQAVPGSGLGLVITRELVQAMGGTLEVSSVAGAGSRFTLRLAAAPKPTT
jgi:PAS domain S-box-containing protein